MSDLRFLSLTEAAKYYGYPSGNAIRMAFSRGTLPKVFLQKLGTRKVVVDRVALDKWFFEREAGGDSPRLFP